MTLGIRLQTLAYVLVLTLVATVPTIARANEEPASNPPAERQTETQTEAQSKTEIESKPESETKPQADRSDQPAEPEQAADSEQTAETETPGDSDVPAGHSYHGETFNEGPRQRAYLMGGTGNVSFPATTNRPEAQQFIDQGVGQLHGFWYFEAERSFRQAAAIDPDCGIAYWGMALANANNEKRAKGFIAEAVKRKQGVTERERMYIDALHAYLEAGSKKNKARSAAYVKALENIIYKHPDDIEAKAFLGLQIWQNRSRDLPISSHVATDALLNEVLAVEPMHPCHHYRIHLWDYEKPEKALDSSALCGQSSPSIAHMWHMPGHIYSRLKRYEDAVWQQEASARVDHAHMMRDRVLPDQIHNFAHNNEWLIRNLIYLGRARDAVDLAKNMVELPRHPKYNVLSRRGSTHFGRLRLFGVLSTFELWDELIALADTRYLEPTDDAGEQIKRLRHLGQAWFRKGDLEQGKRYLSVLEERLAEKQAVKDAAVAEAEEKARENEQADDKAIEKAKTDAAKPFTGEIGNLERAVNELKGYVAVSEGEYKTALDLFKKAGGMDPVYLARVHREAGDHDQAVKTVRNHVRSRKNEVQPAAHLVEILWECGKRDEARKAFEDLQSISGTLDLGLPVFARLAPIANELGFPEDWRVATEPRDDVGERPALDSLGPLRWQPSPAASWTLKDAEGQTHSLADYRGRPVIVIFYLGYGCLHCAEQIQAFSPQTEAFAEAGISLIAVSTDDQDGLQKSIENYKDGDFAFPLVANAELDVFKAYRCYDDFEDLPLHGTFLIDGAGRVLWQDISYEPFMDHEFLLKESRRLLGDPAETTVLKPAEGAD